MRTSTALTITLCVVAFAGCATGSKTAGEGQSASVEDRAAHPPEEPIADVMWAKLGLARAILEGLVTEDFVEIERDAVQLRELSEHSSWMVTDSVTYVVTSDRFRQIVDDLAEHARGGKLDDATADFGLMTETCVACHTYLRRERRQKDYPERVSEAGDAFILSLSSAR